MSGSPRRSSRTSRAERRSSACPRATRTGLTVDLRQRPGRGERHPYGDISHGVRGGPLPRCPPPSLLADEAGGTRVSPMGRARRQGDGLGGWGFPHAPVLLCRYAAPPRLPSAAGAAGSGWRCLRGGCLARGHDGCDGMAGACSQHGSCLESTPWI